MQTVYIRLSQVFSLDGRTRTPVVGLRRLSGVERRAEDVYESRCERRAYRNIDSINRTSIGWSWGALRRTSSGSSSRAIRQFCPANLPTSQIAWQFQTQKQPNIRYTMR